MEKQMLSKDEVIRALQMEPLSVEGGMFRKMFRSDEPFPEELQSGRKGPHVVYGSILYLLTRDACSRMHRLPTDEIWHFYMGASCETTVLCPDGSGYVNRLGQDILNGECVTAVVPRGCWQGTRITGEGEWALLGTTMAPDYEDADYEDGTDELMEQYPAYRDRIALLLKRPGTEEEWTSY